MATRKHFMVRGSSLSKLQELMDARYFDNASAYVSFLIDEEYVRMKERQAKEAKVSVPELPVGDDGDGDEGFEDE